MVFCLLSPVTVKFRGHEQTTSHKLFLPHLFSLSRKRRKGVRRVGPACQWHDALQPRFKLSSWLGPSCSKLGSDNPGLVRDLNSDLKT